MGSMTRKWNRRPVKQEEMKAYLQLNINGWAAKLAKKEPLRLAIVTAVATFATMAVVAVYLLSVELPRLRAIEERLDRVEARR